VRLVIPPGVFRPRSDTWMLARAGCDVPRPAGATALELCTGSGAVAVALARCGWRTSAVDVSRRAVLAARVNARLNGTHVDARRGDLYAAVGGAAFDLIVSNPPYIPSEEGPEAARGPRRHVDGGPDGRAVLDRVIEGAPRHLRPGGVLLVIHSEVCGIDASLEAMRAQGLQADVAFRHRGPAGPILRARAELLDDPSLVEREEEVVVVRGSLERVAAGVAVAS
jgi:release factor glutamine methyltransferase